MNRVVEKLGFNHNLMDVSTIFPHCCWFCCGKTTHFHYLDAHPSGILTWLGNLTNQLFNGTIYRILIDPNGKFRDSEKPGQRLVYLATTTVGLWGIWHNMT